MRFLKLSLRRAAAGGTIMAALALAGCDDPDSLPMDAQQQAPLSVELEVSSSSANPGDQVLVALRYRSDIQPLAGLQGTLRFDPRQLRFTGQVPFAGEIALVNPGTVGQGELPLLTYDVGGLNERSAVLGFEVLGGDYQNSLRFAYSSGVFVSLEPVEGRVQIGPTTRSADLTGHAAPRMMHAGDWIELRYPKGDVIEYGVPGQYVANLVFGDATLNGVINVFDAACAGNVAIGNFGLIEGSSTGCPEPPPTVAGYDAVVAANVFPGSAANPNGIGVEPSGARVVNVIDVATIANEAVGNDQNVPGTAIPGRGANRIPVARTEIPGGALTCPGGAVTWTADQVWELDGVVTVENCDLTIEAGTFVEGDAAITPTALVVTRSGRLFANGTYLEPITFSCDLPVGSKVPGCWGGLLVLGNAAVNNGTQDSPAIAGRADGGCLQVQIEGLPDEGDRFRFGGCNDDDNSGVITYTNIEFGGRIFTTDNETNCLTMGGVGRGTEIDFVHCHAGTDDGFEFFGGTVNVSHVLLTANQDDSFDTSFGWNGSAQFVAIQQDASGDRGIESDNTEIAAAFRATPRTQPLMFNFTMIGNGSNLGATIRRGNHNLISNAVVANYATVLDIDADAESTFDTCSCTLDDDTSPTACNPLGNMTQAAGPTFNNLGTWGFQWRNSLLLIGTGDALGSSDDDDPFCNQTPTPVGAGDGAGSATTSLEADYLQGLGSFAALSGTQFEQSNVVQLNATSTDFMIDPLNPAGAPGTVASAGPDFRPVPGSQLATLVCDTPPATHPFTGEATGFDVAATYCGAVAPHNSAAPGTVPWYSGWSGK